MLLGQNSLNHNPVSFANLTEGSTHTISRTTYICQKLSIERNINSNLSKQYLYLGMASSILLPKGCMYPYREHKACRKNREAKINKNHVHTWGPIWGELTVLIIPSTLQSGRDGIGFVLGNRISTSSRRPQAAASSIGIAPCYIIEQNIRSYITHCENDKVINVTRFSFDKKHCEKKKPEFIPLVVEQNRIQRKLEIVTPLEF